MDKYKYIHFVHIDEKPKTGVWSCRTNKSEEELGKIKWYGAWNQYCFLTTNQAFFSIGCLKDIQDFIRVKEKERKESNRQSVEVIRG